MAHAAKIQEKEAEASATAKAMNLPISTKHSIEISSFLRSRHTADAKKVLVQVIAMKKPLPFRRFNKDTGHRPGMAAGRFPRKAARHFLDLLESVEANAHFKGMDMSALAISHITANRAPRPRTGGRLPHRPKRTHLEIRVTERESSKKDSSKKDSGKKSGAA